MKNTIVIVLGVMSILLTACGEKLEGRFEAHQEFTVFSDNEPVNIRPGQYHGQLKMKKKGENLSIKAQLKNELTKSTFNLEVPLFSIEESSDGSFFIPRRDLQQDFDIRGHRNQTVQYSNPIRQFETCQASMGTRCHLVRTGESMSHVCYHERINGQREVEYIVKTTREHTVVKLSKIWPIPLADFKARKHWSERIYTHVGFCF